MDMPMSRKFQMTVEGKEGTNPGKKRMFQLQFQERFMKMTHNPGGNIFLIIFQSVTKFLINRYPVSEVS